MDFIDLSIRLETIYFNRIVLILCGAFYIAVGRDAVILNEKLGLKVICAKQNICKIGIPKKEFV